MKEKIEDS